MTWLPAVYSKETQDQEVTTEQEEAGHQPCRVQKDPEYWGFSVVGDKGGTLHQRGKAEGSWISTAFPMTRQTADAAKFIHTRGGVRGSANILWP